jgi:hypothetical protein
MKESRDVNETTATVRCVHCDQDAPLDGAGNLAEHMRPVGAEIIETTCELSGWPPADPAWSEDVRYEYRMRALRLGPLPPARRMWVIREDAVPAHSNEHQES